MPEPKFVDPVRSWARAMDEGMALMRAFMAAPLVLTAQTLERVSKVLPVNSNDRADARRHGQAVTAAASSRSKAKIRSRRRRR